MSKQLLEEIQKVDFGRRDLRSQQHRLDLLEQIQEDVGAIAVYYKRVQENAESLGIQVDIKELLDNFEELLQGHDESDYYQSS